MPIPIDRERVRVNPNSLLLSSFLTLQSSTKAIRASLSDFIAYAVHFFTVSSLNSHRALATFGSLASLLGVTALQFSSKYNPLNLSGSALASVPTARYKLGTAPFSGLFDMNVLTSHQTGPNHPIVIPACPSVATRPGLRDVEMMGMFSASMRRWSSDVNRMFAVLLTALRDDWLRKPVWSGGEGARPGYVKSEGSVNEISGIMIEWPAEETW